jgi:translation initiation factor IF-3
LTCGPTFGTHGLGRQEGRPGRREPLAGSRTPWSRPEIRLGLFACRQVDGRCHRLRRGASESARIVTSSEEGEISDKRVRVNDQIRISPVRLIQDDGEQIGIVSIDEARERAEQRGMDLVEVAAEARPPVVKMMDYGKFKYEADRARREARKKQHTIKVKEVKFRPGIEDHDYQFKVGHARRFLDEGNKVKLTMMFRGRQVTHPEIGLEVLSRVMEDLQDLGKVESNPNMEGRIMSMVVAPLKA